MYHARASASSGVASGAAHATRPTTNPDPVTDRNLNLFFTPVTDENTHRSVSHRADPDENARGNIPRPPWSPSCWLRTGGAHCRKRGMRTGRLPTTKGRRRRVWGRSRGTGGLVAPGEVAHSTTGDGDGASSSRPGRPAAPSDAEPEPITVGKRGYPLLLQTGGASTASCFSTQRRPAYTAGHPGGSPVRRVHSGAHRAHPGGDRDVLVCLTHTREGPMAISRGGRSRPSCWRSPTNLSPILSSMRADQFKPDPARPARRLRRGAASARRPMAVP